MLILSVLIAVVLSSLEEAHCFPTGEPLLTDAPSNCAVLFSTYNCEGKIVAASQEGCSGTFHGLSYTIDEDSINIDEIEIAYIEPNGNIDFVHDDSFQAQIVAVHPLDEEIDVEEVLEKKSSTGSDPQEEPALSGEDEESEEGVEEFYELSFEERKELLDEFANKLEELSGDNAYASAIRENANNHDEYHEALIRDRRRLRKGQWALNFGRNRIIKRATSTVGPVNAKEVAFSKAVSMVIAEMRNLESNICKKPPGKDGSRWSTCCGGQQLGLHCCGDSCWPWDLENMSCCGWRYSDITLKCHQPDACPDDKFTCQTFWTTGGWCASSGDYCAEFLADSALQVIEIVGNMAMLLGTGGASYAAKAAVKVGGSFIARKMAATASKQAVKAAGRAASKELFQNIAQNILTNTLKRHFKETLKNKMYERVIEAVTEEVFYTLTAQQSEADGITTEEVLEILDPTGIYAYHNYLNSFEFCVYPEYLSDTDMALLQETAQATYRDECPEEFRGPNGDCEHYEHVGHGWCRPAGCNPSSRYCKVSNIWKDQVTCEECKQMCDDKSDCTGYSCMESGDQRCFVHGHVRVTEGWNTYFRQWKYISRSTGHARANCYRKRTYDRRACNPAENNWNCCSVENPCLKGEGDCDRDDQCLGDLVCRWNKGRYFGGDATQDICWTN